MRRNLCILTLGMVASLGGSIASAAPPARRNVLLIVADDLSRDLGCYGSRVARTPNIDALAARGVRFTEAFATVASCSASRAVIYTGLYTHSNGQFGHAHPPANLHTHDWVVSLPRALKAAGYRTGVVGKLHVLPPEVYPFDAVPKVDNPGGGGQRDVAAMARQVKEFISLSGERPFFLIVGFNDPHRAAKGFGNDTSAGRESEERFDPKKVDVPFFLPDQPEVREELAEYSQAIARLDRGTGLALSALDETGQRDTTLVVFLSDNGMPFPGAKTTLYDPGIHLPLIVDSPEASRKGATCKAMVSWVDIAPTILDWAGAKTPYKLPGRSLLPILGQEDPTGWDEVYGSFVFHEITNYYPMRMIRTRKHKYILNLAHPLEFPFASDLYGSNTWQGIVKRGDTTMGERLVYGYIHRPREELYDLERDPHELYNLAADPAYASVLADLRKRLLRWQTETKDPWIVKYKYE